MFEQIHNTKEQIFFTKEQRKIRQKSRCLNHSNKQILQVMSPSDMMVVT